MKKQKTRERSVSSGEPATPRIHFGQIDVLKGLAIISVILIHTYNNALLGITGAPFWMWQAVPVFLLLAAFTNAYALSAARKTALRDCYDPEILSRRLRRLLVPYTVVWVFQFLVVIWFIFGRIDLPLQNPNHFFYSGAGSLYNFLTGSSGLGNYFVPVILQQVLIVPLLYYFALRSPGRMVLGALVADLILEIIVVLAGAPAWLTSVLYVRYLLVGALGVWLVFQKREITPWILLGALASAAYIFAVYYLGFQFWFFGPNDSFFHAFSYLWTLLLVILGLRYIPSGSASPVYRLLAGLGKASWHIFLVQMTFFFILWGSILRFPDLGLVSAVFTVPPCLIIGYAFYRLGDAMTRWRASPGGAAGPRR